MAENKKKISQQKIIVKNGKEYVTNAYKREGYNQTLYFEWRQGVQQVFKGR